MKKKQKELVEKIQEAGRITIIKNIDGSMSVKSEGFNMYELLGVLRFAEKDVWLKMQKQQSKTK